MKRLLLLLTLLVFSFSGLVSHAQKIKIPCPTTLNSISDCPDTGCGTVDPHLNRQKNMTSLDGEGSPILFPVSRSATPARRSKRWAKARRLLWSQTQSRFERAAKNRVIVAIDSSGH